MGEEYARRKQPRWFEVGDEVIGDECIRGFIIARNEIRQPVTGDPSYIREYVVKSERGERLIYAGEYNLQLVKKGIGDAAPPRLEFLAELDEDLRRRPLAGLRL